MGVLRGTLPYITKAMGIPVDKIKTFSHIVKLMDEDGDVKFRALARSEVEARWIRRRWKQHDHNNTVKVIEKKTVVHFSQNLYQIKFYEGPAQMKHLYVKDWGLCWLLCLYWECEGRSKGKQYRAEHDGMDAKHFYGPKEEAANYDYIKGKWESFKKTLKRAKEKAEARKPLQVIKPTSKKKTITKASPEVKHVFAKRPKWDSGLPF